MFGHFWPTPTTSPSRPCEGNVRLLRAKVLSGEMTEREAAAMLGGKSPMMSQGNLAAHDGSTLSAVGSRANRCRLPDDAVVMPTNDGCGHRCIEFARYSDQGGYWGKTSQGSYQLMMDGSSEPWSGTWPRSGMTCGGTAFRLPTLAPRISGTGSGSSAGFMATPTAKANHASPSMRKHPGVRAMFPTPNTSDSKSGADARDRSGSGGPNLLYATRMWPTPSARDHKDTPGMARTATNPDGSTRKRTDQLARAVYEEMFPTPTASDAKAGNVDRRKDRADRMAKERPKGAPSQLPAAVAQGTGGTLNPTWVEWLMGFPLGWTDLEDSATP